LEIQSEIEIKKIDPEEPECEVAITFVSPMPKQISGQDSSHHLSRHQPSSAVACHHIITSYLSADLAT